MTPKSYKGILKRFDKAPKGVRDSLKHLPKLIKEFPLEVSLGYLFSRVERSQYMTLYCGVVKLHQCDKDVTYSVLQNQHITRGMFVESFKTVIGVKLDSKIVSGLRAAEKVRDKIIHGREAKPEEMRMAVIRVIEYAESYNDFVNNHAGFRPFDSLTGFKGAGKSLSKKSTRWILKGMGFSCS